MKRVVIVGPGAAGKSTLAARLGQITRLPVIELDELFWRPGLAPTPQEEWAVAPSAALHEYTAWPYVCSAVAGMASGTKSS